VHVDDVPSIFNERVGVVEDNEGSDDHSDDNRDCRDEDDLSLSDQDDEEDDEEDGLGYGFRL
jgi:hypothetical protein